MNSTVQPIRPLRKGDALETPSSARTLRECLRAHSVSYEAVAARWGVSKARAAVILQGVFDRLDLIPASVRADWHRRCLAQLQARPVRHIEGECLDLGVAHGRLSEGVREALADGVISPEEALSIRNLVADLAAQAEDIATAASLMPAVAR